MYTMVSIIFDLMYHTVMKMKKSESHHDEKRERKEKEWTLLKLKCSSLIFSTEQTTKGQDNTRPFLLNQIKSKNPTEMMMMMITMVCSFFSFFFFMTEFKLQISSLLCFYIVLCSYCVMSVTIMIRHGSNKQLQKLHEFLYIESSL